MSKSADRRVLVLGGTGFIGGEITSALLRRGHRVRVLARSAPGRAAALRLRDAEVMQGDARDRTTLAAALDDVQDVVDALGAPYPAESVMDPVADASATLPTLVGVLEAVRGRPGTTLLFLSSGGTVYGDPSGLPVPETAPCDPITSYGVNKLAAEKYVGMYVRQHGVPAQVLRVANAYGPHQSVSRGQGAVAAFLACAASGAPARVFGDGSTVRDYVHVGDVAGAVASLLGRRDGPLVVNCGSGEGRSIAEVLEVVRRVTGRRVEVERLPARLFDVQSVVLDVSRLRALLPWSPRHFEEGVAATWREVSATPAEAPPTAGARFP